EVLDPQQRMLLEVSYEAIEDAGLRVEQLRGSATGVYVGIINFDYGELAVLSKDGVGYAGTGNSASTAAGRISYSFGLQGPCLSIDTACSSSLVALHLACHSLRIGETDQGLVAGVNQVLTPRTT